jgi:CHAT domain-containing protein/tetratricopeptide (TPR) repeat protein
MLDGGRYAEAEDAARVLDRESAGLPASDRAAARAVYVEALLQNGRGSEARTLSLARELLDGPLSSQAPGDAGARRRLVGYVRLEAADYRSAAALFTEALRAHERSSPGADQEIARDLVGLALASTWLERFSLAQSASERALTLVDGRTDGPDDTVPALAARAFVRMRRGDYQGARTDYERALAMGGAARASHPQTGRILTQYAETLWILSDLKAAVDVASRALSIAESGSRDGHPDVAAALRVLAVVRSDLGETEQARVLLERALRISEAALGPEHPLVGLSANALAASLIVRGDYSEARRLQRRAIQIYERRLGPSNSFVTTAVYNLGILDGNLGDYPEALRQHRRAIRNWEATLGRGHAYIAWALLGEADALANLGRRREAVSALERALVIRERALGAEHARVGRVLTALAGDLAEIGEIERANQASRRALAIWEKAGVPDGLASILAVQARIEAQLGSYDAARTALERVLEIKTPVYGPVHPGIADAKAQLSAALGALGRRPEAMTAALEAESIGRNHLRLSLAGLPERQGLTYAASRPPGLAIALSLVPGLGEDEATSTLDAVIRGRAVVLDEMAARQHIRAGPADAALAPLFAALSAARQRFANLAVRGPDTLSAAQYAALLDGARRDKEAAETALGERSAVVRKELERKEVGLDRVGAALAPRTAMVSFVRYDRSTFPVPGATGPAARIQKAPAYLAFVLRAGTAGPAVVDLGAARSLEASIARWRRNLASGITPEGTATPGAERTLRAAGIGVRRRIWDPVAVHLVDVDQVFVVPDGALNLLPLAALPSDGTRYLVESGPTIHYLSAERDLVLRDTPPRAARGLLAVGGPAYGNTGGQPTPVVATTALRGSPCGTLETITFPLLPASRFEAEDVTAAWRRAGAAAGGQAEPALILTGANASEAAFKRSGPGRRILHLATHGFFLDPKCEASPAGPGRRAAAGAGGTAGTRARPPAAVSPENPLLQSGLALARANYRATAGRQGEDGILTAEEVAGLDLDGVEWAVLSACDTGLGEIKAGEGVLGLRRAFQIAGARTIVMSLWAVEDQAGRAWMRALYEGRLAARQSTADAVRSASLTVLRDRRAERLSTHPFFWAGFVAAGDWR